MERLASRLPTLEGGRDGNQEHRANRSGHCRRRGSLPHGTDLAGIPAYRYFLRRSRRRGELGAGRIVADRGRGARADGKTRDKWLDRLWQAIQDDGVSYLSLVEDRWGELCGSSEVASRWADELLGFVRAAWPDPRSGSYARGTSLGLSSLLAAGRHAELIEVLALQTLPVLV